MDTVIKIIAMPFYLIGTVFMRLVDQCADWDDNRRATQKRKKDNHD